LALVAAASPFTGAAIDSYDGNILEPADRAMLSGIASAIGVVFVAGTAVGIAALALGALTRRTNRFAKAIVVLALVAPVLCALISFWTIAAAGAPDSIPG
jgi:hypothetical protein